MKHSRVRFDLAFVCVGLLMSFCLFPDLALAGTDGKIMGKIKDQSGTPLPGVAVTVSGTRLGATSDPDGRYFIMRVRPGTHSVTARLIGFAPTIVGNVRVSADLTTEVDFRLEEEAIRVGEVVVTAQRPDVDKDVTSSLTIVDAKRVEEMPVSQMLDVLSLEPGVSVARDNELEIRGGGPSEIRFQVDGVDRTDASTSKSFTSLNQVLVSEVTVLTGGFNAEYGNVRSGVINAVLKDGTEKGFGLPWIAGAINVLPSGKQHFGPGAYDEDQYDYWLMSSKSPLADSALANPIYWPDLYAETRDDTTLLKVKTSSVYRVFTGWEKQVATANFKGFGADRGAFGKRDWTAKDVRTAWEYEANMNEQAWTYSDKPSYNVDLAMGWALPSRLGGIVIGYSESREMTVVPALRPYYKDRTLEAKLTLTPTDAFKISFRVTDGTSVSTGAGSAGNANANPELQASSVENVKGSDPRALRSTGDLVASVVGINTSPTKLNLSYNSLLDGEFRQYSTSATYTFGAATFANASFAQITSKWEQRRDLPRVDITKYESKSYNPTASFSYRAWLELAYGWSDNDDKLGPDAPVSLEDALTPGRVIMRSPYVAVAYPQVPSEGHFVTKEMTFVGSDGIPDTTHIVAPLGWTQDLFYDMSGTYGIGGGGDVELSANSDQIAIKTDMTHATGDHTLKLGAEYTRASLEYHYVKAAAVLGAPRNTDFRDYGGEWVTPHPNYLGFYLQDKYESEGMIANVGVRVERFDGGYPAYLYRDLFNYPTLSSEYCRSYFLAAAEAMGWKTEEWGLPTNHYAEVMDSLGVAPGPWDVTAQIPSDDAKKHWRVAPRFGISHPVSDRSKFFFNFGRFYSMQKAAVMYGYVGGDRRPGTKEGGFDAFFNPSLRPAMTTMYEVGMEHVFPFSVVVTVRGYAKYNLDQISTHAVLGEQPKLRGTYYIYRNTNYEDVKGAEIKISRTSGRFVNGWFTFERFNSRGGATGLERISDDVQKITPLLPFTRDDDPRDRFRAALIVGTPTSSGNMKGGWSATILQSFESGGEATYNPNQLPERELEESDFIPVVDTWSTTLKLGKRFTLARRRSVRFSVDISNLFNRTTLNGSGIDGAEYLKYLYDRRTDGDDIKYGDSSTFYIFTNPYKDHAGNWKPPISPRTDWLHHMNPRSYRFGVNFSL